MLVKEKNILTLSLACLQASSLQFLCRYNFDFNKVRKSFIISLLHCLTCVGLNEGSALSVTQFIYEGVPFLNEEEEDTVRQIIFNQDLFQGVDR